MTTTAVAPTTLQPLPAAASRALWRRWVAANAIGELLGLGATGAVSAAAMTMIAPRAPSLAVAAVVAAGTIEGAVVGGAQWRVMRDRIAIPFRRWVGATVAGALLAWGLGVTPSLLLSGAGAAGVEPSLPLQLAFACGLGLLAGPVLGGPQALALRGRVPRPWRWVAANAAAWACALPVTFLAPALLPGDTPIALLVVAFAVGALAAGAVAGAVHGVTLVTLAGGRGVEVVNPLLHRLLRSPGGHLVPGLVLLELVGRRSGAPVAVVAGQARDAGTVVIVAADAGTKRWWRNLAQPQRLVLWSVGHRRTGVGRLVTGDADLTAALAVLRARRRATAPRADDVRSGRAAIVIVELDPDG